MSTAIAEQMNVKPSPARIAPKSLAAKLSEVMAAVGRIAKRGHNDFHHYDYATEADIVEAIRGELAARHVLLVPAITDHEREKVGDKGSVLTTLRMEMTFIDGDTGETLVRPWLGAGTDKEDKGAYKAMTGGEKYFLLKTFLIPTGDDPEQTDQKPAAKATFRPPAPTPREREKPAGRPVETAADSLPSGAVRLRSVNRKATRNASVTRYEVVDDGGILYTTIKDQLGAICEQALADGAPVVIESKDTRWGHDLVAVHRAETGGEDELPPLSSDDIPFAWIVPLMLPALTALHLAARLLA